MPVETIHLGAPRTPELWTVESVQAVAGKGLEGDRHFHACGAPPGQALTLVAAEVVEEIANPRKEIARIGRKENDTNVSIADFTILPIVQDDEPTRRRGR